MGCGETGGEEKLLLNKLEKFGIQVMKERELNKSSKLEGKNLESLDKLRLVQKKMDNSNSIKKSPVNKSKKTIIKEKKEKSKKKVYGKRKVKIETSNIKENNKSFKRNGKLKQSENIKKKKTK